MTVTAGTPFTVNSDIGSPEAVGIDALDSSKAIAFYETDTAGFKARIIQDDESLGSEFTLSGAGSAATNSSPVSALSSTKAICVYEQGGGALARILNISGTTITAPGADLNFSGSQGGYDIAAMFASAAIAVVDLPLGRAYYLTVSGSAITNASNVAFEANDIDTIKTVTKLTATKAVVVYRDLDDGNQLKAVVLSVSGTTISAGSSAIIDAGDDCSMPASVRISDTSALVVYRNVTDGDAKAVVLSGMSGTSVTVNTPVIIDSADIDKIDIASFSATEFVATYERASDNSGKFIELAVSGVTVSTVGSITQFDTGLVDVIASVGYSGSTAVCAYSATLESVILTLSGATVLGLAAMTKPADVDAAGEYIYVALLEGATPILTKISTALNADGTTVFDPGGGDNIGVECGRFSSDTVWVAGNFDGTNVVEKSEDGGTTFTVKDDGTIGDVRTFVMGPDSDERILVFDETNGDILETIDDGASWTAINAAVTPEVNAIARFGKNVQEAVFGNDGAANNSINYSVNSGGNLADYQTGVYPNANATRVIVN